MLSELFSYKPQDIDPAHRALMANILEARGEYLRVSAEISNLRARAWDGEKGLDGVTELKAAYLTRLRTVYTEKVNALLKESVDLDGLVDLIPAVIAGVLQNFKIPLPVIMEAVGLDLDKLKKLSEDLKELIGEM